MEDITIKNIFCCPTDWPFSDPDIAGRPLLKSASRWKIAADGKPHDICKIRNPRSTLLAAAWNNSCLPSSDTSEHLLPPHPLPC